MKHKWANIAGTGIVSKKQQAFGGIKLTIKNFEIFYKFHTYNYCHIMFIVPEYCWVVSGLEFHY